MSYAEGLRELIGQNVEIYCGSSRRSVKYADFDIDEKSVVRGKLTRIIGDCIVVECRFKNGETLQHHTNDIFINAWSICAVCVPDESLSMVDMFVDEGKKQLK